MLTSLFSTQHRRVGTKQVCVLRRKVLPLTDGNGRRFAALSSASLGAGALALLGAAAPASAHPDWEHAPVQWPYHDGGNHFYVTTEPTASERDHWKPKFDDKMENQWDARTELSAI